MSIFICRISSDIMLGGSMKKPVYIRCPRCELNYIEKKEKLCSVCKAELSAKKDEYTSDLDLELCPICKTNYISPDEIMCSTCLKEHQTEDGELNSDWEDYLNRDEDEIVDEDEETGDMASVTELGDNDMLDDEIDTDIGFDETLDDDIDIDEDFDDEEEEDEEDDDFDDDLDDDDDDEDDDLDDDDDDF